MDPFEDVNTDPAADFLTIEKEELGDALVEELGIDLSSVSIEAETQEPLENVPDFIVEDQEVTEVIADTPELSLLDQNQEEIFAVNQEMLENRDDKTPSPAFVMPPRPQEEPETLKQWRLDQAKRLEEKDTKEADTMAKLKAEAEHELKEW